MNNLWKNLIFVTFFCIFSIFVSCTKREKTNLPRESFLNQLNNGGSLLYRFYCGEREGFNIWIVDGEFVRKYYFDEFIYGGNGERYTFIPTDEIWIDNGISAAEFEYTLQHEINEFILMNNYQMSYYDAHDSSLMLELKLRKEDFQRCRKKERTLPVVATLDFDSVKEIPSLPDKIKLKGIYKTYVKKLDSIDVWIVDGSKIRREIYPDFGYSGNDLAYLFIPRREIWIDDAISCQQLEYSIQLEIVERSKLLQGLYYNDAYEAGKKSLSAIYMKNDSLISTKHIPPIPSQPVRDVGEKNLSQ